MTTATVINLRTRSKSGNDLPGLVAATQQLLGEPYLFARRAYADEVTFHFGTTEEYTLPKFGIRKRGSLVLSTRGSAWLLKSLAKQLLATDWSPESLESLGRPIADNDLDSGAIVDTGALVVSANPFVFEQIDSFALRILLSDGTHLTILPTPNIPDDEGLPDISDWELLTPHDVLKVGPYLEWKLETRALKSSNGESELPLPTKMGRVVQLDP